MHSSPDQLLCMTARPLFDRNAIGYLPEIGGAMWDRIPVAGYPFGASAPSEGVANEDGRRVRRSLTEPLEGPKAAGCTRMAASVLYDYEWETRDGGDASPVVWALKLEDDAQRALFKTRRPRSGNVSLQRSPSPHVHRSMSILAAVAIRHRQHLQPKGLASPPRSHCDLIKSSRRKATILRPGDSADGGQETRHRLPLKQSGARRFSSFEDAERAMLGQTSGR